MRTATGKGNDARKVLTYYRVNFGIHPAYKVLCDAPIIHLSFLRNISLKDSLPRLLGAVAFPLVTRCILEELRSLGNDFANAATFAKRAAREPCTHGTAKKTASECIYAFMASGNKRKLLLATNDAEVIRKAMEEGDIPVVTIANQTRLALLKPTALSIENVKQAQEIKSSELRPDEKVLLEKTNAANMPLKPRKVINRKRKRPKGPNPLSVKKGKKCNDLSLKDTSRVIEAVNTTENIVPGDTGQNADPGTNGKRRGRRRRKRKAGQCELEKG